MYERKRKHKYKMLQVSWIRTRDLHILTSGALTFSADSRFESVHSSNGDFWGLRLRGARIADTGQYECQVNTDPKMSLAINLVVTGELLGKTGYLFSGPFVSPNLTLFGGAGSGVCSLQFCIIKRVVIVQHEVD